MATVIKKKPEAVQTSSLQYKNGKKPKQTSLCQVTIVAKKYDNKKSRKTYKLPAFNSQKNVR